MRLYNITVVLVAVIASACSLVFGQEPQPVRIKAPASGAYRMLTEAGKTKIPFEFISNHVVIPVKLEGKTLDLILDTGMPLDGVLLFGSETVSDLALEYVGKAPVMGVGGHKVMADLAMGVSLTLPGVEFSNQMALVMPQDSTLSRHFEGKDGVIGNTLFSRLVVGIDHDNMEITLTEPDRFEYAGPGTELPLRIDRYPFLSCEADIIGAETVPLELVVDTGNGAALTLNVGAREGLGLPDKVIEYHTRSVGQEIPRLAGRIERLQLGPYILRDLLASFRTPAHEQAPPWERSGGLGQDVLRRFNTLFDYTHGRIILEPNGHFDEPFEFNMAGIQFSRTSKGGFEVSRVVPGSPADRAGVRLGDHIIRLNGRPTSELSMDDAEQMMRQEGKAITLDIRRGNESLQLDLTLERLI